MNEGPIFLEPVFKEAIWGGENLKKIFKYNTTSDKTSECWGISAHEKGDCKVISGLYQGLKLSELWNEHRELFNNSKLDRFPYLVKILDANKDLSVQVHPDSPYASKYENGEMGKYECWYILDCKPGTKIILGHNARDYYELVGYINTNKWSELLKEVYIKPGDFICIPPGTIHAIRGGTLVLEIQQSSDLTYRLFDYNRRNHEGRYRELHLDKALEVINIPFEPFIINSSNKSYNNIDITEYIKNEIFNIEKWSINGECNFENKGYLLVSVIKGSGYIYCNHEEYKFSMGENFIITSNISSYKIKACAQMIISYE